MAATPRTPWQRWALLPIHGHAIRPGHGGHPRLHEGRLLLRAGLTPAQLVTLEALEIFQWRLAFVRRPLFQAPIPVLFDRNNERYIVIREDGTLDEQPTLKLRD